MLQKKLLILPLALAGFGIFTVSIPHVQAFGMWDDHPTFVSSLAKKLGVDEAKVKDALSQMHEEKKQKREKNLETRLSQLVEEKKLTKEQKDLLLAKIKALKPKNNWDSLSREERKSSMQKVRQELEDFAKKNNISLSDIFPFGKEHRGMMMR